MLMEKSSLGSEISVAHFKRIWLCFLPLTLKRKTLTLQTYFFPIEFYYSFRRIRLKMRWAWIVMHFRKICSRRVWCFKFSKKKFLHQYFKCVCLCLRLTNHKFTLWWSCSENGWVLVWQLPGAAGEWPIYRPFISDSHSSSSSMGFLRVLSCSHTLDPWASPLEFELVTEKII